jgi:hypothetical protein
MKFWPYALIYEVFFVHSLCYFLVYYLFLWFKEISVIFQNFCVPCKAPGNVMANF